MKVCVINPGVVHAHSRTAAFSPYFDEVHYIDLVHNDVRLEEICDNITVHTPGRNGKKLLVGKDITQLLERVRPDGIVCHFASGIHLVKSILYNRCPVAAIGMGSDILYDKGNRYVHPLQRLLIRMTLRQVDYLCAKSGYLAERLSEYKYSNRLDINYWGASTDLFKKVDKEQARSEIDVVNEHPVILSPRAVQPIYNIDLIVRSMNEIIRYYPKALLVVIGRTSEEYRGKIETMIREAGLGENIRLVYEVDQQLLVSYYSAADVVVSMSSSEGFPNTLLEVMACETPIVAGRIPQIEEILEDNINARLCEIDHDAIARAVIDLLGDRNKSSEMAMHAYSTMRTLGDIDVNGKRFADEFMEVIADYGNDRRPLPSTLALAFIYSAFLVHRRFLQ